MADDIVEVLRMWEADMSGTAYESIYGAAADELERLRAAGDALAAAHADDLCDCGQPECVTIRAAHDTWKEARRGTPH